MCEHAPTIFSASLLRGRSVVVVRRWPRMSSRRTVPRISARLGIGHAAMLGCAPSSAWKSASLSVLPFRRLDRSCAPQAAARHPGERRLHGRAGIRGPANLLPAAIERLTTGDQARGVEGCATRACTSSTAHHLLAIRTQEARRASGVVVRIRPRARIASKRDTLQLTAPTNGCAQASTWNGFAPDR